EDEERSLKRILGVVVFVQEAATNAPDHRGVPSYQGGKGVLVPTAPEAGQEFPIGQAVPVRPAVGREVLDDPVQWAGRHRLSPRPCRRLYVIILVAGRFDPPV